VTELGLVVADICVGVLIRREPDQAFTVDVDPQRVKRSDDYVNSQVELISVQDKWVVDVLLDNALV